MNFHAVAKYLNLDVVNLNRYYDEIIRDKQFLSELNRNIVFVRREFGFKKGIFRMLHVPSVDWFAFSRVLLYVLVRALKPQTILETGVYYGGNTAFLLKALSKNKSGRLISIDLPDSKIRQDTTIRRHPLVGDTELYSKSLQPGFIVPEGLKKYWEFIEGDSLKVIPQRREEFQMYLHDSDHSMPFLQREMRAARRKMADDGLMIIDDIDWSNAFYHFCANERFYPLMLTDNGKDDLRVRTGLVLMNHPRNRVPEITGS